MPEAERASRVASEAELRHRVMAHNGGRLRLSNGGDAKDSTCKMVLLGCPGVGKTG